MERTSEYYSTLSSDSKARYTEKVKGAGLKTDPYVANSERILDGRTRIRSPSVGLALKN